MNKPRVIAFYLPQYHPTPHNDEWWGKGFTEWTNVGKAKPLYKGHYQPRVPTDLGYYDLRLPEVREQQANMARECGIEAFCYYHYWFGNGKMELERPFEEVLNSGKPDFPFCLCWANESWHSKFWNIDGSVSKNTLIEQTYPGAEDTILHFKYVLKAFKDPRYYRVDDKPLFAIYQPLMYHNCNHFMSEWRRLAKENGLSDIYFIAYTLDVEKEYSSLKKLGFDSIVSCRLGRRMSKHLNIRRLDVFWHKMMKKPYVYNYAKIYKTFIGQEERNEDVIPTLIPNWDHTPRSGVGGYLYENSTPEMFTKHIKEVFDILKTKKNKLCFIKSWNEWGEGNYLEPDLRYGRGYMSVIKEELDKQ